MLTIASGNLLHADADALVNTVNTVGVMGKGIALQFRRAYPQMFTEYVRACKNGEVQLGHMHVWETGALDGPRFVINFPTKQHWRASSRLPDIEDGLTDLVKIVRDLGITSIAIPPLGCGNGGLNWADVEPLIRAAFVDLPDVEVLVFPPGETPRAREMPNATSEPTMTAGRAALVTALDRYSQLALGASPIEVQKLMYFLQVLGEPLKLRFEKNRYGPYADNLRHVLNTIEGHFVSGFGDGSAPVLDAESLSVLPGAVNDAQRVLAAHPDTVSRLTALSELIDGFESRYGMELLATVHWVVREDPLAADDLPRTARAVQEWTPRKRGLFTDDHIELAWTTLRDHGLFAAPVAAGSEHR